MIKSPISILQEYAVMNHKNVAYNYSMIPEENKYKSTCTFDGKTAIGQALSKKDAKFLSASNMLDILGLSKQSIIAVQKEPLDLSPRCNFIGELKEFCDRYRIEPIYHDLGYFNGCFVNEILLETNSMKLTAKGTGFNKKEAKQKVAEQMLKLIQEKTPAFEKSPKASAVQTKIESANFSPIPKENQLPESRLSLDSQLNAISLLNNYCAKNKSNRPEYIELEVKLNQFGYRCKIENQFTEGRALTKKLAKLESAQNMLNLLEVKKIEKPKVESYSEFKIRQKDFSDAEIAQKFDAFSVSAKLRDQFSFEKEQEKEKEFEYKGKSKQFEEQLKEKGIAFEIDEIQKDPLILSLSAKIDEQTVCFSEMGASYNAVSYLLLKNLVDNMLRLKI